MEYLYKLFCESQGVCTDTRKIKKGQLFFALKGDNFDGNRFATKALDGGASYAVVDDASYSSEKNNRFIVVENVLETLQNLATYHREQLRIPVIGLTGSNGKTTTKELITAVLSSKYKVRSTKGNLNNHIGVPLTVLSISSDDEVAVVEMGANHIGEIAELCIISRPTIGIITNIGHAHLEGFGSYEGVVQAKTELYQYLANKNGLLLVNDNDEKLKSLIPRGSLVEYSLSKKRININSTFPYLYFSIDEDMWETQLTGEYNLDNILMALLVGRYFHIDIETIKVSIESYSPENNRSQVKTIGTNTYILDHYNANPSSMSLSVKNLAESDNIRKVLILGDMNELGAYSVRAHREIIELIKKYNWYDVYTVGSVFYEIEDNRFKKFETSLGLKDYLRKNPIQNSTVLLKGSRGITLEKIFS